MSLTNSSGRGAERNIASKTGRRQRADGVSDQVYQMYSIGSLAPSGLKFSEDKPVIPRRSGLPEAAKRLVDIVFSISGLVFLLPLLIVVALLVKVTSPGPVFFKQPREGKDGRLFGVYKFRTMRVDQGDRSGIRQTTVNDARVTTVGRFLRRFSIDELPQLLNVLGGSMSLVGPRPHVAGQLAGGRPYRDLVPYYDARHAVKPGITGLAQVHGLRGPTTDGKLAIARIEYDLLYVQNWSFWLDMKILLLTVKHELCGGTGF